MPASSRFLVLLISFVSIGSLFSECAAGPYRQRSRRIRGYTPVYLATTAPIRPIQNNFFPTPMVILQGNLDTGPGYSPLGLYGDTTMSDYGPFSVYRAQTTNLVVRTRGYDGLYRTSFGVTETYPNFTLPGMISAPNRRSDFFKPRGPAGTRVPGDAINWLDLQ